MICGCSTDNTLVSEVIRFVFVVTVKNKSSFPFFWTIVLRPVSMFVVQSSSGFTSHLRPRDLSGIELLGWILCPLVLLAAIIIFKVFIRPGQNSRNRRTQPELYRNTRNWIRINALKYPNGAYIFISEKI